MKCGEDGCVVSSYWGGEKKGLSVWGGRVGGWLEGGRGFEDGGGWGGEAFGAVFGAEGGASGESMPPPDPVIGRPVSLLWDSRYFKPVD